MNELTDKVAVVTGAGRGIGKAIAQRLASQGATVILNYANSVTEAGEAVTSIQSTGGRAVAMKGNVSDQAEIASLFTEVQQKFGRLDILVNNAGVAEGAPLGEITVESIDRVFSVNVKGVVFATQGAAKYLRESGRIINIGSSTSDFPTAGLSVYAGSKAVVKIFTEVWAKELAPRGITVNTVQPGPTSPGLMDKAPQTMREAVEHASPFARIGRADEVAAVVSFLCTEEASWVSGQHILVNGGGNA